MRKTNIRRDANPDPITGEPGAHPVELEYPVPWVHRA
jgi:hypothetical protein